ncbi:MAG: hypothetical protein A3G41_05770 [Elusimicrobia bacterium RIFCSPLOWO2_12_FULL_59_9]|nr:MAG: hypothetical protein A3G41_05770 [Elusimicrobia bacterium RIFCSPLOWO2_12_FULL_59_9]
MSKTRTAESYLSFWVMSQASIFFMGNHCYNSQVFRKPDNDFMDPTSFKLDVRAYGLRVIYAAAYVLMDRAYVLLEGNPKSKVTVYLKLKSDCSQNLKQLRATFLSELATQKLRWMLAEANQPVREHIIKEALQIWNPKQLDGGNEKQLDSLSGEDPPQDQREELDRLLSEVKEEWSPKKSG